MKLFLKILFLPFIFYLNSHLAAQNHNFATLDSTFSAFSSKIDRQFDQHLEFMDSIFFNYLEQHWDAFPILPPENQNFYSFTKETQSLDEAQKITYTSFYQNDDKKKEYLLCSFPFFGKIVSFQIDKETKISMSGISEKHISSACRQLTQTDISYISRTAATIQQQLKLNDWGYFQLFEKLSYQLFNTKQESERTVFIYFLLLRSGFDVKLGRTKDLTLLIPFSPKVFLMKRIYLNKKYYYLYGKSHESDLEIYTYKNNHQAANQQINLNLNQTPALEIISTGKKFKLPSSKSDFTLSWNSNLIEFYKTYPHTELSVYFNAGISEELKSSFLNTFEKENSHPGKVKTINKLLSFFHNELPYKSDKQQFGYEWKYFPEQTFAAEFTDCEDRAIAFAQITKILTGLETVLLVFPEHVAVGVCFDKPVDGFKVKQLNKSYIICDPSFHGAAIGNIMPGLDVKKISVIGMNSNKNYL